MSDDNDGFDFDYWKNLYEKDPEEADRQRLALLRKRAASIRKEENRDRLLAQVFHQTMELDRIKDPNERLNRLQVKFWKMFQEFNDALHGQYQPLDTTNEAKVIPFRNRHEKEKDEKA